jgi:hypothetical protein
MIYRTRVIAESYDFEKVKDLTVECPCGTAVPDAIVELSFFEPEFPFICQRCGRIIKLSLAELDGYADSLTLSIEELFVTRNIR